MSLKILIVGGYGVFGGRIVELLEHKSDLTLIISGRSLDKAESYCAKRVKASAILLPQIFDRTKSLDEQLKSIQPDILIDASGPFQNYGSDCYKLIEACIKHKVNYLDLADGADFVRGAAIYDDAAKAAGVFVLSGVSSFPVLTALVVQELSKDMVQLDTIHGGIAPSPFAVVGGNVIRAIASYAGQPIKVKKGGAFNTAYPFTESHRYTVSVPGRVPLKSTLFSLIDVPDLHLLSDIHPDTKTIWMGAGPVPEILHRMLIWFAWLVRWKILPSLSPLANLIQFVISHFRWGEHRGGMIITVTGCDKDNKMTKKSWHLLAEGEDGPYIPCLAVNAVINKLQKGDIISAGSRTAVGDVTLDDYEELFAPRTIYTGFREDNEDLKAQDLYPRLLGNAWDNLPQKIKDMHSNKGLDMHVEGRADIERGRNPLSHIVAAIIGFPKAGADIPVTVDFTVKDGVECWKRTFDGKSFLSYQYAGKKRWEHLLVEKFGMTEFAMALVSEENGSMNLVLRHWSVLGVRLPLWLCPRTTSYEIEKNDKFHFNVETSHPLLGKIVHYKGWLE